MEKNDYIQWLIHWFLENSNCTVQDLDENFFNNAMLSSFGTLQLVTEIESAFNLSLPDTALTDPRFSTVNGLASILYEYSGDLHVK